jgi:hypothetical protein
VIPLGAAFKVAAIAWVGATWLSAYRAVALRAGGRGTRAFEITCDVIAVLDGDGRWWQGRVAEGSFVAPWLTIVRWRPAGARFDRTILILPGMLSPQDFRRLRVLLRYGSPLH